MLGLCQLSLAMVRYLGVLLACFCFTLGHVQELTGDVSVPKSGDIVDSDKSDVDGEKLGEEELDEFDEDLFEEEEEVVGRKLWGSRSRSYSSYSYSRSRSYYYSYYSRSRSYYYYSYGSYYRRRYGGYYSGGHTVFISGGGGGGGSIVLILLCIVLICVCAYRNRHHGHYGRPPSPRSHHSPPRSPRHFGGSMMALPPRPPLDPNYLRDFIRALRDEYLRGYQNQVGNFLDSNNPGPHGRLFDQIEDMVKGAGDRERFLDDLEQSWELRSGFVPARECDSYAEPLLR